MRNLISQNAVCATHACDTAIYCSNSLSLRENHIIWQSVCHWNILLWVMACVELCVLYIHTIYGSLCTTLPCPDEKNPLDKIFQWARLNCVLRVTPKEKKVMGPFKPHFCTFQWDSEWTGEEGKTICHFGNKGRSSRNRIWMQMRYFPTWDKLISILTIFSVFV